MRPPLKLQVAEFRQSLARHESEPRPAVDAHGVESASRVGSRETSIAAVQTHTENSEARAGT
jgi:hypothetical protein